MIFSLEKTKSLSEPFLYLEIFDVLRLTSTKNQLNLQSNVVDDLIGNRPLNYIYYRKSLNSEAGI